MSRFTVEQHRENRKTLVDVLRSGRYRLDSFKEPVVEGMFNPRGYTWVSVAWKVYGVHRDDYFDQFATDLPQDVQDFYGFRFGDARFEQDGDIVYLAHDTSFFFYEVADIIESEPPGLFIAGEDVPKLTWQRSEDDSLSRSQSHMWLNDSGRTEKTVRFIPSEDDPNRGMTVVTTVEYQYSQALSTALHKGKPRNKNGKFRHVTQDDVFLAEA